MNRKLLALTMTAALLLSGTAIAEAPVIESVEYEGQGYVEVEFLQNVRYETPVLTVTNNLGLNIPAELIATDDDDVLFRIDGFNPNQTYSFTLGGVRAGLTGAFESVSGEFTTPDEDLPFIKNVDTDLDDKEIDVEFLGRVRWNDPVVTVRTVPADPADEGEILETRITERDNDGLEVRVKGLKKGEKYVVEVSGVSLYDAESYVTVSREFTAIDD